MCVCLCVCVCVCVGVYVCVLQETQGIFLVIHLAETTEHWTWSMKNLLSVHPSTSVILYLINPSPAYSSLFSPPLIQLPFFLYASVALSLSLSLSLFLSLSLPPSLLIYSFMLYVTACIILLMCCSKNMKNVNHWIRNKQCKSSMKKLTNTPCFYCSLSQWEPDTHASVEPPAWSHSQCVKHSSLVSGPTQMML